MARQVTNFTFKGTRRYPWETWMDGATWELEQGKDFDVSGDSFRSAAYTWSKRNGVRVSVSVSKDKKTVHLRKVSDCSEVLRAVGKQRRAADLVWTVQ